MTHHMVSLSKAYQESVNTSSLVLITCSFWLKFYKKRLFQILRLKLAEIFYILLEGRRFVHGGNQVDCNNMVISQFPIH